MSTKKRRQKRFFSPKGSLSLRKSGSSFPRLAPPQRDSQGKKIFPKRLWNLQLCRSRSCKFSEDNLSLTDVVQREGVCRARMAEVSWPWEFGQTYETQFGQTYWDTKTLRRTQYSWLVWYFFLAFLEDQKKSIWNYDKLSPLTALLHYNSKVRSVNRQKRAGRQVKIKALLNSTIKSLPTVTNRAYSDH